MYPTSPPVQWLPGTLFLAVKPQAHEAVHPLATRAEVNNECHCTSLGAFVLCTILLLLLHSLYLIYFCVFPLHLLSERSHTLTSSSFHILSSCYYRYVVLKDVTSANFVAVPTTIHTFVK